VHFDFSGHRSEQGTKKVEAELMYFPHAGGAVENEVKKGLVESAT
jgi:hypothetical protein